MEPAMAPPLALVAPTEAMAARDKAVQLGNAQQVYFYGRQLQTQKKKDEAIAVYRSVAQRFPDHWLGHLAKARAAVADADFTTAMKEAQAAQSAAPEPQKSQLDALKKRIEAKEDINS